MKILHFFKTALPATMGGVENVIDQISRGSINYGIKSTVLALTDSEYFPDTFEFNGYKVHLLKRDFKIASTDFAFSAFRRFSELAIENDIIHYHFPWPFMDLVHFSTFIKKPSVLTYHSDIVKQKYLLKLYWPLMNSFLNSVDKIIVTSPNYLNSSQPLQKFKHKSRVIPIGIDRESYPPLDLSRLDYWRNIFGTRFFLFIGVLRYYKGLDVLLEANDGLDLPVVIVGDGPLKESLQADSIRRGLRNTYFLGSIDDVDKMALLSLCLGMVFPSNFRSEAFGVSLLEAAMHGKPLISCEIGSGTSYINVNGLTGIVALPNNPHSLRVAMLELWGDSEKASRFGRNALHRFNNLFTQATMIQQYFVEYNSILSSK
jgi:glycosyltransferase involved in cell wall biosynthesis